MRHGDGRRFLTNPALLGRPEAPVVFANVMQLYGRYYITGPTFPADGERVMRRAVVAGTAAIEAHNNRQPGGQKIYTASSPAEALTLIWGLLTAHYGIQDAAAQVQQYELRQATDRRQEEEDTQAALELAQLGTTVEAAQRLVEISYAREATARQHHRSKCHEARAAFPLSSQEAERKQYSIPAFEALQRAIQVTTNTGKALAALVAGESPAAAVPVGNTSTDWIPDYPQAADELSDEHRDDEPADDANQDSTEYPEYPGDEQHDDSQDDYPADVEAEAIGDLYNSQWE